MRGNGAETMVPERMPDPCWLFKPSITRPALLSTTVRPKSGIYERIKRE
jgi:hypothetical protein